MVIIDEMGKFLESAAYDSSDVYFFQQLAEIASRSDNRLVVVGILHQAFDEYANRVSRESREEWAKIQGRFGRPGRQYPRRRADRLAEPRNCERPRRRRSRDQ